MKGGGDSRRLAHLGNQGATRRRPLSHTELEEGVCVRGFLSLAFLFKVEVISLFKSYNSSRDSCCRMDLE